MKWTSEMDALGSEMMSAGRSPREIGAALGGLSRNSILGRAHRQGWARPDSDAQRRRAASAQRAARAKWERIRTARALALNGHRIVPRLASTIRTPIVADEQPPTPLMNAHDRQCRYFLSERPDWIVCGALTVDGKRWCQKHYEVCFTKFVRRA